MRQSILVLFVFMFTLLTACGEQGDIHRASLMDHTSEQNDSSNSNGETQDSVQAGDQDFIPVDLPGDIFTDEDLGEWKSLLFTGDNSITAFDNATQDLSYLFSDAGILPENIKRLSMDRQIIREDSEIALTSLNSIESSLKALNIQESDKCLVHMTSHGSRTGFYLVDQGEMSPDQLNRILERTCGDRPTVLLISSCYSGIHAKSPSMQKPNRIILTAATHNRTSFGCSPENQYTYWDGCLLDHLTSSTSWKNLYENVNACIEAKEDGRFTPSLPQLYIGDDMHDFEYLFQD